MADTEKYTTINVKPDTKEAFFASMEEEQTLRRTKGEVGNITQDDFLRILLQRPRS